MNDYSSLTKVLRDINQINFVRIFIIIIGAWVVMRMVERAVPWLAERLGGRFRLYILPSIPVMRLLIINVALILLVPTIIEPTLQNLAAIFAALAIALGFAVKDFGSSLVAGIVAIYERPYRPGDWVKIDRAYGEVKTVGLRAMRLVTPDDDTVTIPHLKFWDTNIYNANDGRRDLMCVTDFYLHPHHDGALVRRKLRDVALTSPYLNHERPIVVVLKEEVWGTHYKVRAYPIDCREQFQFISDIAVRGKAALLEMGVELGWRPLGAGAMVPAGDSKESLPRPERGAYSDL
ncbi:MAG: mechanosensitive ion channel [Deltaproteobacteria bacterium]|nr:mechanosensitive ion channel [Deltaproteobacteria bacterium]